ncbi:amino acid acetyltransferase [Bacterioplanes sanyensis]|uniref:GNAT family N-acetyltransferase n=1 Tax=Bacterioplanes sanyensis TaxID=1249553 RepID=UPI00167A403D|nr:GNAT family N-acetyltransferase [Bacterioplanes sanyensis]GGY56418.1 amino acid acetyltransferase [Bacterioplanes sanyensis]
MTITPEVIDACWRQRMGIEQKSGGYLLADNLFCCDDEHDLAFIYHSPQQTLVSCRDSVRATILEQKLTSLQGLLDQAPKDKYEIYIDDVDYYLFNDRASVDHSLVIRELNLAENTAEIQAFIDSCEHKDIVKADFDIDSDCFYAVMMDEQIAGMLASYCGQEPFESLSIVVKPEYRQLRIGQALLAHLVDEG